MTLTFFFFFSAAAVEQESIESREKPFSRREQTSLDSFGENPKNATEVLDKLIFSSKTMAHLKLALCLCFLFVSFFLVSPSA